MPEFRSRSPTCPSSGLTTGSVAQVNLVSNSPSIPAPITDPNLVNPWGIAGDADGNAWVADEGSGVATYEGPGGSTPEGTYVVIPPASGNGTGSPAGIVYNPTSSFTIGGQPSVFLYATLDGTISGWNGQYPSSGHPSAVIAVNNSASGAVYTGLAIATLDDENLLYAANFASGQIDVYNSSFTLINQFSDPNLPAGYAPYNVASIGGDLYVTFAKQGTTPGTAVAQLGAGFVDVFSPAGTLLDELIQGVPLDAPFGIALAPASFGQYSGDLLVANQGNGQVNAFNPTTGVSLGSFQDDTGTPITNDGLHGLFVNPAGNLYFTAAPAGPTERPLRQPHAHAGLGDRAAGDSGRDVLQHHGVRRSGVAGGRRHVHRRQYLRAAHRLHRHRQLGRWHVRHLRRRQRRHHPRRRHRQLVPGPGQPHVPGGDDRQPALYRDDHDHRQHLGQLGLRAGHRIGLRPDHPPRACGHHGDRERAVHRPSRHVHRRCARPQRERLFGHDQLGRRHHHPRHDHAVKPGRPRVHRHRRREATSTPLPRPGKHLTSSRSRSPRTPPTRWASRSSSRAWRWATSPSPTRRCTRRSHRSRASWECLHRRRGHLHRRCTRPERR